jgi:hypothetical protein
MPRHESILTEADDSLSRRLKDLAEGCLPSTPDSRLPTTDGEMRRKDGELASG